MVSTPSPKSPSSDKSEAESSCVKQKWLGRATFSLALLAVISSGLLWQQASHNKHGANNHLAELRQSISELQASIQQNRLHVQTTLDNTQKNIDQLLNQRDTSAQQAIGEAEYLIRLAHLHLVLGHDLETSLKLLNMASERLSLFHTTESLRLQAALHHDVTLLKAVPAPDISSLWMQINTLSAQIAKLPIRPEAPQQTQHVAPQPLEEGLDGASFWDKVKHALGNLKALIVIHHFDKPVTPLLSPEQLLYLRENIQLKLSQAQWAVLYQDDSLYQQSLEIAAEWMNTYDQNQNGAAAIVKKLKQMALIKIAPAYPNQLKSMTLLHPAVQSESKQSKT